MTSVKRTDPDGNSSLSLLPDDDPRWNLVRSHGIPVPVFKAILRVWAKKREKRLEKLLEVLAHKQMGPSGPREDIAIETGVVPEDQSAADPLQVCDVEPLGVPRRRVG